jgi:hypothetical protein
MDEMTQIRVPKSLNERLKTVITDARKRVPVASFATQLLTEALDAIQKPAIHSSTTPTITEYRSSLHGKQRATTLPPDNPMADLERRVAELEAKARPKASPQKAA